MAAKRTITESNNTDEEVISTIHTKDIYLALMEFLQQAKTWLEDERLNLLMNRIDEFVPIGNQSAGKTTILQRLCSSADKNNIFLKTIASNKLGTKLPILFNMRQNTTEKIIFHSNGQQADYTGKIDELIIIINQNAERHNAEMYVEINCVTGIDLTLLDLPGCVANKNEVGHTEEYYERIINHFVTNKKNVIAFHVVKAGDDPNNERTTKYLANISTIYKVFTHCDKVLQDYEYKSFNDRLFKEEQASHFPNVSTISGIILLSNVNENITLKNLMKNISYSNAILGIEGLRDKLNNIIHNKMKEIAPFMLGMLSEYKKIQDEKLMYIGRKTPEYHEMSIITRKHMNEEFEDIICEDCELLDNQINFITIDSIKSNAIESIESYDIAGSFISYI